MECWRRYFLSILHTFSNHVFQIGDDQARFLLTNIEAMEIVVNVGLDGQLSPNTVTTSHMGRIYQWFLCPEGGSKGGPSNNMFKIRPRGKYPHQRFPYIPFASRRFRHYKRELAKKGASEQTGSFFNEFVKSLKGVARKPKGISKSRSEAINEWKKVKKRLIEKREKRLAEKLDQEDTFVYDISPSLSSLSLANEEVEEKTGGGLHKQNVKMRVSSIDRWNNLCNKIKSLEGFEADTRGQPSCQNGDCIEKSPTDGSDENELSRKELSGIPLERDDNVDEGVSPASASGKQTFCEDFNRDLNCLTEEGPPKREFDDRASSLPYIDDFPTRFDRPKTSSPLHLHPKRSIRRLGSSSSDLVSLSVAENRPAHRNRRSVVFLENLASRMTHFRKEAQDEPTCECNSRNGSLKNVELSKSSHRLLKNPNVRGFDLGRYWATDLITHPGGNKSNRLFCDVTKVARRQSLNEKNTALIDGEIKVLVQQSNAPSKKRISFKDSKSVKLERPTLTVSSAQENLMRTYVHLPDVVSSPVGANIIRENHSQRTTNEISSPVAQYISGVLAKSFKNGRPFERFLFNPCWPVREKAESRKITHANTPETSCGETAVGICVPSGKLNHFKSLELSSRLNKPGEGCRGVREFEVGRSIDVLSIRHQSPMIAKCTRVHSNKNPDNEPKSAPYCISSAKRITVSGKQDVKKNRQNSLLFTEKILIHPVWKCQRTCKTDIVGYSPRWTRS